MNPHVRLLVTIGGVLLIGSSASLYLTYQHAHEKSVDLVWRALPAHVVLFLLVMGIVTLLVRRYVRSPLGDLAEGIEAFSEGEVRLVAALEQLVEAVAVVDAEGCVQYVNPALAHAVGCPREALVDQGVQILRGGRGGELFEKLSQQLGGDVAWEGCLGSESGSGTLRQLETTISPVRDPGGAVVAYVSVGRDVTADRAQQTRLLEAQRMESVGQLAGGVAHDFNNLLSVILTQCELIAADHDGDAQLVADVGDIREACTRAATLTHQLLAFSRRQVLRPEVVDLNGVVGELGKMLTRLIGENIELQMVLGDNQGAVLIDRGQIEQVLVNLVVNARDAMPEGGRLTVETSDLELDGAEATDLQLSPGRYVVLSVADSGHGIAPEILARIFEPFFTTKELGKGTGLGLATVYGIVRQSKGHISVSSDSGLGTTFRILLPRVDPRSEPIVARSPIAAGGGSEIILVVEDESAVRTAARRALEAKGYTVLTAGDGREALKLLSEVNTVDLVLTDLIMPNMGGRELATELARGDRALRVLLMSGYAEWAQGAGLEAGAHFLQKPFSADSLACKVREALDGAG